MAESEILDQVDEEGNIIGKAKRSEFHSNPDLIHQVVHCWLFNSKGEILWQQRSLQKATSPGKWDMSCGGHILSGDDAEVTIARELEEELGIVDQDVHLVEKYIAGNEYQTELINLYYGICDLQIEELTLQEEEVEKAEWIKPHVAQRQLLRGDREGKDFLFDQVTRILEHLAFDKSL